MYILVGEKFLYTAEYLTVLAYNREVMQRRFVCWQFDADAGRKLKVNVMLRQGDWSWSNSVMFVSTALP